MDTLAYALLLVCRYLGKKLVKPIGNQLESASYVSLVIQYAYTIFINITGTFVTEKYLSPDHLRIYVFIELKMFKLNMEIDYINQCTYYTSMYISVVVVQDSECVRLTLLLSKYNEYS